MSWNVGDLSHGVKCSNASKKATLMGVYASLGTFILQYLSVSYLTYSLLEVYNTSECWPKHQNLLFQISEMSQEPRAVSRDCVYPALVGCSAPVEAVLSQISSNMWCVKKHALTHWRETPIISSSSQRWLFLAGLEASGSSSEHGTSRRWVTSALSLPRRSRPFPSAHRRSPMSKRPSRTTNSR